MSGSHNSPGPFSAVTGTVSEELKQHAHATPAVKASNRGYVGAFLLSGSGFLFVADDFASYPEDLKIAVAVAAVARPAAALDGFADAQPAGTAGGVLCHC